ASTLIARFLAIELPTSPRGLRRGTGVATRGLPDASGPLVRGPSVHRAAFGRLDRRSAEDQRRRALMASFDYDVAIIGSGFGGSVAALRAAEKGYRVGVMESGKRWKDGDIPKTQWDLAHFVWFPAAEFYGVQRIEYLDDVLVLSGAGVGGGSHVYASTLYVPPKQFFAAPEWAGITDW